MQAELQVGRPGARFGQAHVDGLDQVQHFLEALSADLRRHARGCLERFDHVGQRFRFVPVPFPLHRFERDVLFQPGGQRVGEQVGFGAVFVHRVGQALLQGGHITARVHDHFAQRFRNDLPRRDRHPKDPGRHPGDVLFLLGRAAPARHRGRSADTDQFFFRFLVQPADQHRHIGPLPAAVGVQFIEYQVVQAIEDTLPQGLLFGPD